MTGMLLLLLLDEGSEGNNIYNFFKKLPDDIDTIINSNSCNLLQEADKKLGIKNRERYSILVYDTYKETFELHDNLLKECKERLSSDSFYDDLISVGMARRSYKLKAIRLTELFKKLKSNAANFIDVKNKKIKKLLVLFLEHLESILGSLSKLFPSIEKIIELLQVLRSIANEL
jgi:hypothetical protein